MIKFFNPYYLLWLYRLPKLPDSVRVKYNATIRNVIFGGDNVVNKGVKLVNCDIGKGSYISINSSIYNTKIGKFCSIGRNLSNSSSQHPSSINHKSKKKLPVNRGRLHKRAETSHNKANKNRKKN